MKRIFVVLTAALILAACGGKNAPADNQASAAQAPAAQTAAAPPAGDEGVQVAKDILGVFDEAVAEAAALLKDKPQPAEAKAKLAALYDKYAAKMAEFNPRYLALKAKDIRLFGAANGYLGDNRGKHVYDKDIALTEALRYYNLEKGEKEIVDFLSSKLPALIDAATKQ